MDQNQIGGATEAARVLDVSVSQFNAMRLKDTHIYDPVTESLSPVDPNRGNLREFLADKHLVAPTLAGHRQAGGRWEYNLTLLRRYRRNGWPGAKYPMPCDPE